MGGKIELVDDVVVAAEVEGVFSSFGIKFLPAFVSINGMFNLRKDKNTFENSEF